MSPRSMIRTSQELTCLLNHFGPQVMHRSAMTASHAYLSCAKVSMFSEFNSFSLSSRSMGSQPCILRSANSPPSSWYAVRCLFMDFLVWHSNDGSRTFRRRSFRRRTLRRRTIRRKDTSPNGHFAVRTFRREHTSP